MLFRSDPERFPGFVGAIGPDGPIGYATDVRIAEVNSGDGQPRLITVRGRGPTLNLSMQFEVGSVVSTRMQQGPLANNINFLQLRGTYSVTGSAGDRAINFTAPGSAETFRGATKRAQD